MRIIIVTFSLNGSFNFQLFKDVFCDAVEVYNCQYGCIMGNVGSCIF